jgi:hypothetical protein
MLFLLQEHRVNEMREIKNLFVKGMNIKMTNEGVFMKNVFI